MKSLSHKIFTVLIHCLSMWRLVCMVHNHPTNSFVVADDLLFTQAVMTGYLHAHTIQELIGFMAH